VTNPHVTYPVDLSDLALFADAAAELDGHKCYLPPTDAARIAGMVKRLHDTIERVAGAASGLIYQDGDGPMLDYEVVKAFYFAKGASDCTGRGRFESAFFHTIQMVFEQGIKAGAKTE
jgi:hypothetical protein